MLEECCNYLPQKMPTGNAGDHGDSPGVPCEDGAQVLGDSHVSLPHFKCRIRIQPGGVDPVVVSRVLEFSLTICSGYSERIRWWY